MIERQIIKYPDPLLKTISAAVSVDQPELISKTVGKLQKALHKNPGVGIAAVQLGIPQAIFIMNSSYNKKLGAGSSGEIVFINPKIVEHQGSQIFREGCLSVPDYTADIVRSREVTVQYLDAELQPAQRQFSGFEAVIVQHEYDHLIGKLFLDRVSSPRKLFLRQ